MRNALIAVTALLLALPAVAQNGEKTVVCQSINNTRHTCRVDIRGGISLTRQLSDNVCVRGKSWGINQRGVWVDRGCRAEFTIGAPMTSSMEPSTSRTLLCESGSGKTRCPIDTSYGVSMAKRLSKHACAMGRDWGYDENGVWVANGCRAEFTVNTSGYVPMASSGSRPVMLCESKDGHRNFCPADTTFGVSMSRQLSDKNCVPGETWGYDSGGIWVTKGCRAEFLLDTLP